VVSHLCDRTRHDFQFGSFLRSGLERTEARPLAFIIYGETGQGHDSFVERVLRTQIDPRIQELWGQEHPSPPQRKVLWESLSANLDEARSQVADTLVRNLGGSSALRTRTYRDLDLLAYRPNRAVVIRHRLQVERWTATNQRLLRWYLEEYWPTRFLERDHPNVLLFLQLVCDPAERLSWRTLLSGRVRVVDRMRRGLERLVGEPGLGAARILIDELTPVTQEHVRSWCITHDLFPFPYEARCEELARKVFSNKDKTVARELPMAVVEKRLDSLLKQMTRRQQA
jgi:hypothetical protein